jgi:hypothetical protein
MRCEQRRTCREPHGRLNDHDRGHAAEPAGAGEQALRQVLTRETNDDEDEARKKEYVLPEEAIEQDPMRRERTEDERRRQNAAEKRGAAQESARTDVVRST